MLMARKGDGALQLTPLCSQAQALGLKARVFISKLLTKQVHRVSRPSKESLAKSATLPGALEHIFHTVICPKQAPGAVNQHPLRAGGWGLAPSRRPGTPRQKPGLEPARLQMKSAGSASANRSPRPGEKPMAGWLCHQKARE